MDADKVAWGTGAWICAAWWLIGTLLSAIALTWQSGSSLETFNAHSITGSIVIISFVTLYGPKIAALSIWLGLVFATNSATPKIPASVFAALPFLALASAAVAAPIAMGVATLAFPISPQLFWGEVIRYLRALDFVVGFGRACAYAATLAACALFLVRPIHSRIQNRVAKVAMCWVAVVLLTAPIDFTVALLIEITQA